MARYPSITSTGRRRTVDETALHVTSVFTKRGEHAVINHPAADSDEETLVALGYKQEFKRFVNSEKKGVYRCSD